MFPEISWLQQNGFRVWYDEGIAPGRRWADGIGTALKACSHFVVFISQNAANSPHVQDEINLALNRHKPFLAVHLEETTLPDGLELRMGGIQAVMKYEFAIGAFRQKLILALPLSTRGETAGVPTPAPLPRKPASRQASRVKPAAQGRAAGPPRVKLLWLALAALGALGVLTAIGLALLSLAKNHMDAAGASDMVVVPAGDYCSGPCDESTTVALVKKYLIDTDYGKDRAGVKNQVWRVLQEILATKPKQVTVAPFLLDRHEVTNEQYRQFLAASDMGRYRHRNEPAGRDRRPTSWSSKALARLSDDECPVVSITWYDAYAFAMWAGKRLPTSDEWEAAARGAQSRVYPWGKGFDANKLLPPKGVGTKLGPLPVSWYPPSSPCGAAAMAGNVCEWTGTSVDGQTSVCGASFNNVYGADLFAVAFRTEPRARSDEIITCGFRCAADADARVKPIAPMVEVPGGSYRLGGEDTALLRVLRSVGTSSQSTLKALVESETARRHVQGFKIDRFEVSNTQYARFLAHVQTSGDHSLCHPDEPGDKDHTPAYWSEPKFNDPSQPVVGIDWYDAYAYARWQGKRLPTVDEWEKAARGSDGRLYPWGTDFDATLCTSADEEGGKPDRPFPVDSNAAGASPCGALNMAGNVAEWVATRNPDSSVESRFLMGGGWNSECRVFGLTYYRGIKGQVAARKDFIGFRCAAD